MIKNSIIKFRWLLAISLLAFCFVPLTAHAAIPDTPLTSFPTTDNFVNAVVAAPDGSVYIGGSFTDVGGTTRNGLAHILADGSLDASFNPNISGDVFALALDTTTNTLYVGGAFNNVNGGTIRNNMAAFNASTGVVTSFDPNMNDYVRALVFDSTNNILYAGGNFTSVNGGTTRNGVAAFTTSSNIATSFDPNINDEVDALALDVSNNTLYASGRFTQVNGGTSRTYFAAIDTGTGTATSFAPNPNDGVMAILFDSINNILYIGGFFTSVNGGTTRNGVAAFDTTTSTLTGFDPNMNVVRVRSFALDPADDTLYIGGGFNSVNGGTTRNHLAAFDTSTGIATSFNPDMGTFRSVNALSLKDLATTKTLFVGGEFTSVGGVSRPRFAAFRESVVPPAPTPVPVVPINTIETLAPTGQSQYFFGGLVLGLIGLSALLLYQGYRLRKV